ncbi:MAG: NADH-quinone oxidoreductase subunit C [Caulobacterales bacterium]
MAEGLQQVGERLRETFPDAVLNVQLVHGELTIVVSRDQILTVLEHLRDAVYCQYQTLVDICGADYPERAERFEVVYHLLSMRKNRRIRVKVSTSDNVPVKSAVNLWPVANWFEREAFDMYGILFDGHPDLRRLLTDYGFQGYPLRKEFPLTGFVEVRYDDAQQRVIYEPVTLTQEFRNFDFVSPWEGMLDALPGDEKAKS